jgi:hypothetical protein
MTEPTQPLAAGEHPIVRTAVPADLATMTKLSALDGRPIGAPPHLVAELDGVVVAALSADGSVVSDPSRFTLEAIAALREHAAASRARPARVRGRRRGLGLLAVIAASCLVALGATTAVAAPKPGLPAGTWVGDGSLSGVGAIDGGPASTFSGGLRFTIVVTKDGTVSGSGQWSRKMVNTEAFGASVESTASVTFSGTPTSIHYDGTAQSVMTITQGGLSRTLTMKPLPVTQELPITRAGACRATGTSTFQGVTFSWTAHREISGKCRT